LGGLSNAKRWRGAKQQSIKTKDRRKEFKPKFGGIVGGQGVSSFGGEKIMFF